MKKAILICVGILIGLIAYGLAAHFGVVPIPSKEQPTEQVAANEPQQFDVFYDVNEFLTFIDEVRNINRVDSLLTSLPQEMTANIAYVCIKKYGYVDRATFYKEYINNDTYKYLPSQQQQQQIIESTPDNKQGGNQAVETKSDTIASVAVTKEGTTRVE